MIFPWIEGTLLLTQVAFLAVAASVVGNDILVPIGKDDADFDQSITFRGEFMSYYAIRAVDEDVETCSRTANTLPRWWRITLKSPLNVSRILVIGGKDRSGQELQMDKVNVTIAPDDQSSPVECKLSEFLAVEDLYEWYQFNCSRGNSAKIIRLTDLRQSTTEFSLCEVKVYESVAQPDDIEQESLVYEVEPSAAQETRSSKMLLAFIGLFLLLSKSLL